MIWVGVFAQKFFLHVGSRMGILKTSIAASPFNDEDHAQRQAALAAAGVDGGGVDARALDVSRSQRSVKWEL